MESKQAELEREHQVRLDDDVPRHAVALASAFVLSERHPAKALKILRRPEIRVPTVRAGNLAGISLCYGLGSK